ncbi:MAG: alpha/beta hydrolase [Gammaproteobacteria bacterium]|nr:alpha/beta hydrolase [Gammaproteobacteria bacterium]
MLRGRGNFQAGPLLNALGRFARAADKPPDGVDDYLHFYALDHLVARQGCRHRLGYLEVEGERIATQCFEPAEPKGTAVVCHGYYDHVGLYGHLIEYLLDQELTVLCFDQPGHGLSTGMRATIGCFNDYVASLEAVLGELNQLQRPYHLLGQSMGGAVVLERIAQRGLKPFTEVVLFAPLIRPAWWSVNRILWQIAKRTIEERPRTITKNAGDPDFVAFMRRDPLQSMVLPVQWVTAMANWMQRFERIPPMKEFAPKVIQGHSDKTVGWRHNLKVLNRLFSPDVLHLPDARHHLVNESAVLRAEMWRWLSERCRWHEVSVQD